jgi:hypothetical protein
MTSKTRDVSHRELRNPRGSGARVHQGRWVLPVPETRPSTKVKRVVPCYGQMEGPETDTAPLRTCHLRAGSRGDTHGAACRLGDGSRLGRRLASNGLLPDLHQRVPSSGAADLLAPTVG